VPLDRITPITERERNKMKMEIEVAIWNSKNTKVLAVETFNSTKELLDFMKELQLVEEKASYNLLSVRKGK
jgi:hypothetical protein